MSMRGFRAQPTRSSSLRITRNSNSGIQDENSIRMKNIGKGPPANTMKNKAGTKRKADVVEDKGLKKRSTFGDITNAIEKTLKEKGKREAQKFSAPKAKLRTSSFNVLGKKTTKGKENATKIQLPAVNNKPVKKTKAKQVSLKTDICDSFPTTQGLLASSKTTADDSSNYITASEGSPITRSLKSIKEKVDSRLAVPEKQDLPDGVEDYDYDCESDVFAVSIYAMDIFKYYKEREKCFVVEKYMPRQPQISKTMRAILVDWMVEVQESFELNHETLYLAVKLVDYYLTKTEITRDILQLVGSTSLFIACKFDERIPPYADDFLFICDNAYKKEQLFSMEIKILKKINYDLGIPLSYRFLRRYARCCKLSMEDLTLARYILERSLMEYDLIDASDSALAAAVLLLSRAIKNDPTWTPLLEYYSGYKVEDIYHFVHVLHNMLLASTNDKHKTIKTKYSHKVFFEVATIPVPEELGL